jgi:hypothetical protein
MDPHLSEPFWKLIEILIPTLVSPITIASIHAPTTPFARVRVGKTKPLHKDILTEIYIVCTLFRTRLTTSLVGASASSGQLNVPPPSSSQRNLDPNLDCVPPAAQQDFQTNKTPEATTDSDSMDDPALTYYFNKRWINIPKVCPFSDSSRTNPCSTHDRPRARKDAIMKHLVKKKADPDMSHPQDDPLWESDEVKYFLQPRPPRFDDRKRKAASHNSQHRYYVKRMKLQEKEADSQKEKYLAGEINAEVYKKYLYGHRRREFVAEERVKVRIEQELRDESERQLQEKMQERLRELRIQRNAGSSDADGAIIALEQARNDLDSAETALTAHRRQIATQSANVVKSFADEAFLSNDKTFLEFHQFSWPNQPSVETFYIFATLLSPSCGWDGQIRSQSSIRHMKKELWDYIQQEKELVDVEEIPELERIMATFNSSCDLVKKEEERMSEMTTEDAQDWLDNQESLWQMARVGFNARFKLNTRPAIQLIRLIDDFADVWRGLKDAEDGAESARQTAHTAASRR